MTVSPAQPTEAEFFAEMAKEFPTVFNTARLSPSPEAIARMEAIHARFGDFCTLERVSGSFTRKADGTWPTQAEVDDTFIQITEASFKGWQHSTFWPEERPVWSDVRRNAKRMLRHHPLRFARHFGRFVWQWATWREPQRVRIPLPLRPTPRD